MSNTTFERFGLTEEQVNDIANEVVHSMPDDILGFTKTWGWQQFATALLDRCEPRLGASTYQQVLDELDEPELSGAPHERIRLLKDQLEGLKARNLTSFTQYISSKVLTLPRYTFSNSELKVARYNLDPKGSWLDVTDVIDLLGRETVQDFLAQK